MIPRFRYLWGQPQARVGAILLVVVGGAGVLGTVLLRNQSPTIPTAEVIRGSFIDSLQFRAEVKALKSAPIAAPADAGDLQVIKIATDGAQIKKGDAVVEFDKTRTEQDLAQYKSTMKSAQAEIEQAQAQARLTEEENVTAMMKARYDVEIAKLEAGKKEIVSKIEGEEAKLRVADSEQKLREAKQKQESDRTIANATIQSKVQARRKAQYDVQRAERALAQMILRAPAAGTVSLVKLWRPDGQAAFKPGDRAWPGAPMAELPDMATLRISSRVDETERGRLQPGQLATVQLDAIPDRQFTGHINQISTLATADFSGGWPFARNFNLEVALEQTDSRLRPGMTAQLTIVINQVPNALSIPAQASFQTSGHTVAYVLDGAKFEERVIELGQRSGDRVLVAKGLRPGERVALRNPTMQAQTQ